MNTKLHPIAAALATADQTVAKQRVLLAAAKARRTELKVQLITAIQEAIRENPAETNVALAARFGMRSETSVRNLRNTMKEVDQ